MVIVQALGRNRPYLSVWDAARRSCLGGKEVGMLFVLLVMTSRCVCVCVCHHQQQHCRYEDQEREEGTENMCTHSNW